jgi:RNA polymerase sigma factor (sigma-70 family)
MEAASAVSRLPARLRAQRFERECERLRPLGEAYVLRRFSGALGRADAEDVVAEVLLRLHRRMAAGQEPDNLRAVFFTAVRNAAIDLLRSHSAKPTVSLEAAMDAPIVGASIAERTEGREDAARLREALARMRGNYRETILLRFGLGLTVPEIAAHFDISVAAAKKRVLRATAQVRKRMAAIEEQEFCPEMRKSARSSLLEKRASGLESEAEAEALRAHFAHCGSCRSHLAALRSELYELGSLAVLGLSAGQGFAGDAGFADQAARWLAGALNGFEVAAEKARQLALRASGSLPSSEGAAGALVGTGQKVAAICGTAAATATCVLTGAVGPGVGGGLPSTQGEQRQPAPRVSSAPVRSQTVEEPAPAPATPPTEPAPEPAPREVKEEDEIPPAPAPAAPVAESQPPPSEFGLQGGSAGHDASQSPSSAETASPGVGEFAGARGAQTGSSKGSAGPGIGFQG